MTFQYSTLPTIGATQVRLTIYQHLSDLYGWYSSHATLSVFCLSDGSFGYKVDAAVDQFSVPSFMGVYFFFYLQQNYSSLQSHPW